MTLGRAHKFLFPSLEIFHGEWWPWTMAKFQINTNLFAFSIIRTNSKNQSYVNFNIWVENYFGECQISRLIWKMAYVVQCYHGWFPFKKIFYEDFLLRRAKINESKHGMNSKITTCNFCWLLIEIDNKLLESLNVITFELG